MPATKDAVQFFNQFFEMISVRLKETSDASDTDNGTEFVIRHWREYYEKIDWDLLFQPLFDDPPIVDLHAPEVIAYSRRKLHPEHACKTPTPIFSHDVEEDNHDIEVAHMGNDPYFGIPIPEVSSDQSSSDDKGYPLENIIGAPLDRPVSTRLQLHEQALFCYYDAFLTSVEPKNYKEALTQACWIEAMQEELHEFERLEGWELVPSPDKALSFPLLCGL
ncbi:hypothetical protein Tco_0070963 [Tanacetum coccineum]